MRSSLTAAAEQLSGALEHVAAGRTEEASAAVEDAGRAADSAYDHSRGPVWWLGGKLPWIGDDVTVVRRISEVTRDLTGNTLPSLVETAGVVRPAALNPKGGRIDVTPFVKVAPRLEEGADAIAAAYVKVDSLETDGLLPPLRGPVDEMTEKLRSATSATRNASIAAHLLPPMLGEDERRTYLMIFQNNAEVRAQGGMPGALAVFTAEDGRIRMARFGRPAEIGRFMPPFVELTEEERELFTRRVGIYPQDTVFIPDFARSSELLKQMWERTNPEQLDGLISIDPVGTSYLLRGTGPIRLESGTTLTADNAADYLMRDVYLQVDGNDAQNEIFAEVAGKVFDALLKGGGNAPALVDGLAQAAEERRLMLWSSHPEEQDRIARSALAGRLPIEPSSRPEVGVYLNDSAADKLSYYLDYQVDVTPRSCQEDRQLLDVRVTMRSTVPAGATLPPSVVGPPQGHAPGTMLTSIYVYAPIEGGFEGAVLEGEEAPVGHFSYRGRDVAALTLSLKPGEERVVEYSLLSGPDQTGAPRLVSTPTALGTGKGKIGGSACS